MDATSRNMEPSLFGRHARCVGELREVVEELAEHDKRPRIRDAARAALGT
jgi:hypothetical protein